MGDEQEISKRDMKRKRRQTDRKKGKRDIKKGGEHNVNRTFLFIYYYRLQQILLMLSSLLFFFFFFFFHVSFHFLSYSDLGLLFYFMSLLFISCYLP